MKPPVDHEELCSEIAGELRDITRWLAGGTMNADQFRLAVAALEERKVARFGFRLSSSVAADGSATFTLRFADTGEHCTTLRVDPQTEALRREDGAD